MEHDIDFVILWVDGNDKEWQKSKKYYWDLQNGSSKDDGNNEERFRDWGNLKYWFRAVENYAPWVRKIHFVTCGQIPDWMNTEAEKLNIVNHEDFIPNEFLPTFNCNSIENNLHRIPDLSEHFVYFNDDMFLTNYVEKTKFFVNGLQRECARLYPLANTDINDSFNYLMLSNSGIINDKYDFKKSFKNNFSKWVNLKYGKGMIINLFYGLFNYSISGIEIPHLPSALKKSTYNEVWNDYGRYLIETTAHKFRDVTDVTQYLYRYWEIMKGEFVPTSYNEFGKCFYIQNNNLDDLYEAIINHTYDMICINDSKYLDDFECIRDNIIRMFEKALPNKSSFEI